MSLCNAVYHIVHVCVYVYMKRMYRSIKLKLDFVNGCGQRIKEQYCCSLFACLI